MSNRARCPWGTLATLFVAAALACHVAGAIQLSGTRPYVTNWLGLTVAQIGLVQTAAFGLSGLAALLSAVCFFESGPVWWRCLALVLTILAAAEVAFSFVIV